MNTPHAERAHAPFSPSAAHRWLACPASVRLAATLPEQPRQPDAAADFGTACHELAEAYLRRSVFRTEPADDLLLAAFQRFAATHANAVAQYTPQRMAGVLNAYLGYIEERLADTGLFDPDRKLVVERHVVLVRGKCSGTVDAALLWHDELGSPCIEVIDLKTGTNPVEAEENPQLLAYAVGVAKALKAGTPNEVRLTIVQPDRYDAAMQGPVSSWTTNAGRIVAFEAAVKDAIKRSEREEPKLGDHCTNCPALAVCPAQHQRMVSLLPGNDPANLPSAETLTPQQLAFILQHKQAIIAWLDACEQLALLAPPPGWRVVEGTPRRRMRDKEAVLAALQELELPKELLIATEERVVTVTEAERRLKQHPKREEILSRIIDTVPGTPKLVPVVGKDPVDLIESNPVAAP